MADSDAVLLGKAIGRYIVASYNLDANSPMRSTA